MQESDVVQIKQVAEKMDVRAPDMTEIRLLTNVSRGSAVHCTLQAGQTSLAGRHETIEEIWYCIEGQGDVWLKRDNAEREEEVVAGTCFTIPVGTYFQVRNTGSGPLCFVIVTMPPWPGEQEWVRVKDHWPTFTEQ
jgi:mannose-6-phosphate isomerase-like protein (cupin superfamily)